MSGERYNVVFSGEIADGHNESVVKASLRKLLNINDNQLNKLFISPSVTIKKNAELSVAEKLVEAFSKVGAVVELKPVVSSSESRSITDTATKTVGVQRPSALSSAKPLQMVKSDDAVPDDEKAKVAEAAERLYRQGSLYAQDTRPGHSKNTKRPVILMGITVLAIVVTLSFLDTDKVNTSSEANLVQIEQPQNTKALIQVEEKRRERLKNKQREIERKATEKDERRDAFDRVVTQLDSMIARWEDAVKIAASSTKLTLAEPLAELQKIRRDTNSLEVPLCLEEAKGHSVNGMDEFINGFQAFMQNADESDYKAKFQAGNDEMAKVRSSVIDCSPDLID